MGEGGIDNPAGLRDHRTVRGGRLDTGPERLQVLAQAALRQTMRSTHRIQTTAHTPIPAQRTNSNRRGKRHGGSDKQKNRHRHDAHLSLNTATGNYRPGAARSA